MAPTASDELQPFSVIKFFKLFEKAIARTNHYPLTKRNLVIQQDAYKRLGDIDEEELFEPFAELEFGRRLSDTSLRFAIQFTGLYVLFDIENLPTLSVAYEEVFDSEEDAVKQLMAMLKMLVNGQLRILTTTYYGKIAASELVLMRSPTSKIVAIGTFPNYARRWSENDETGYDTVLFRNNYAIDTVAAPKNWFLLDDDRLTDTENPVPTGRIFKPGDPITPLTKKQYGVMSEELTLQKAGKQPDESFWSFMYTSWEFWALCLGMGGLFTALKFAPRAPGWVHDLPPVVFMPFILAAVYFFLIPYLQYKQELKRDNPNSPRFIIDRLLAAAVTHLLPGALVLSLFLAQFPATYTLKHSERIVNIFQLPVWSAVLFAIPTTTIVAALCMMQRQRTPRFVGWILTTLVAATIFIMNAVANDTTNNNTPEPWTTLAIITLLASPFGTAMIAFRTAKNDANTTAIFGLRHLQIALNILEGLCSIATPLSFLAAAYLFSRDLPVSASIFRSTTPIWLTMTFGGIFLLMLVILRLSRVLAAGIHFFASTTLYALTLLATVGMIKGDLPSQVNLGWALLIFPGLLALFVTSLTAGLRAYIEKREIQRGLFAVEDE